MAENMLDTNGAMDYLERMYGIKPSYQTLRNWVLRGYGDRRLSATAKKIGSVGRKSYNFTAHELSEFVKAVGKDTLKAMKRGRPAIG